MLIRKINFSGHPVLGNLSLDFCDDSGVPFQNVILAGANGVGKTAILESIQSLFEWESRKGFGKIGIEVELDAYNIKQLRELAEPKKKTDPIDLNNILIEYDGTHPSILSQNDHQFGWASNGEHQKMNGELVTGNRKSRFLRSFYSQAQVNFSSENISTVKTSSLDDETKGAVRSDVRLSSTVSQLLVDIRAQDAEDALRWVEENPGEVLPDEIKNLRMRRFSDAFTYIFPNKKLVGLDRVKDRFEIKFSEFGRFSNINELSSGEKQIVFRGGFVLGHLRRILSGVLLLDEPELSLHPSWQEKIYGFYRRLLPNSNDQKTQLIIATHSPFVIHDAPDAKILILERDSNGDVKPMQSPLFPSMGKAVAIRSFNIDHFIRAAEHEVLVLVEGETDRQLITLAWNKLYGPRSMPFELRPALGAKNINITLNDDQVFLKLGSRKIVGIFDFDDAYNHWNGVWRRQGDTQITCASQGVTKVHKNEHGWAILLPVPEFRKDYASLDLKGSSVMSIEFLFEDNEIPDAFIELKHAPLGQKIPHIRESKKHDFVEHARLMNADKFMAFKPLFCRLLNIAGFEEDWM